jgi:hypothetical protein
MLYLLNTEKPSRKSDTPVDGGIQEKSWKVGRDAYSESSLDGDPYSMREGFGISQVSRVVPAFFGYGFFQLPHETVEIGSVVYWRGTSHLEVAPGIL